MFWYKRIEIITGQLREEPISVIRSGQLINSILTKILVNSFKIYLIRFVIGSALSHVANIVLLVLVNADERRKYVKPLPTEKTNSAVLLY